jgi:hypothetical protein
MVTWEMSQAVDPSTTFLEPRILHCQSWHHWIHASSTYNAWKTVRRHNRCRQMAEHGDRWRNVSSVGVHSHIQKS